MNRLVNRRKLMVFIGAAVFITSVYASNSDTNQNLVDQQIGSEAYVEVVPDGFFLQPNVNPASTVTIISISTMDGESVVHQRSHGDAVEVMASDLADGEYYYSIKNIYKLAEPVGSGADRETEGVSIQSGQFRVLNHSIEDINQQLDEATSFIERIEYEALAFLGNILDYALADTQAASLAASDPSPTVYFNDTGETNQLYEWRLRAANGADGSHNFTIYDDISNQTVMSLNGLASGAGVTTYNSIVVQSDGDVTWADAGLFFDRSVQRLAIGANTFAPSLLSNITIFDSTPDIRFYDESDTSYAELQLSNGEMQFWGRELETSGWNKIMTYDTAAPDRSLVINDFGDVFLQGKTFIASLTKPPSANEDLTVTSNLPSFRMHNAIHNESFKLTSFQGLRVDMRPSSGVWSQGVFSVNVNAPRYSLFVDSTGNVGMGASAPQGALHVYRDNGTAKILVRENSAVTAPRTLFQISNNGNTKFVVQNTYVGVEWAFANPGTGFRLSRQGSGVVEMEILNNGNMVIAGALTQNSDINAKTAIKAIDPDKILAQVASLDIKKWEYKDARGEAHIGPMAQDFYATFNLGGTETGISTIDTAGVALVAIQELSRLNANQAKVNVSQVKTNKNQAKMIATQTQTINQLKFAHQQLLAAYHAQEEKLEKMDALEQTVSRLVQSLEGKAIYTSLK